MQSPSSTLITTLGRWLLGLYFLVPAILKFTAWDMHIAMMERHAISLTAPLLARAEQCIPPRAARRLMLPPTPQGAVA